MDKVIKTIGAFLNNIHNCKNEELPLNFDYENEIGMYFEILNKSDVGYKNIFSLQIHFISTRNNKLKLFNLLNKVDDNLNSKIISDYWVKSNEPLLIDAQDDKYEHYILNYHVNEY